MRARFQIRGNKIVVAIFSVPNVTKYIFHGFLHFTLDEWNNFAAEVMVEKFGDLVQVVDRVNDENDASIPV